MHTKNLKRVHLKIAGRVQGVSFRWYTQKKATQLGVTGWVKNLADGRVELEAEGDNQQLEQLVNWCQHGPELARVDGVEVKWEDASGSNNDFVISF